MSNSAWFIGAGFAPLVALFLASRLGLWSVGIYLLSGVICTLAALAINASGPGERNERLGLTSTGPAAVSDECRHQWPLLSPAPRRSSAY